MAEDIDWFLGRDGQQYGPIKNDEMQTLARLGQLRGNDLLWRAGLADWRPAAEVFGLGDTMAAPIEMAPEPVAPIPEPEPQRAVEPAPRVAGPEPREPVPAPVVVTAAEPIRERPRGAIVPHPAEPATAAPAPVPPKPQADRVPAPERAKPASATGVKFQRRLALAIAVPVLALALAAGLYVFWDDLFGSPPTVSGPVTGDPQRAAATPAAVSPAATPRPAFASAPVWGQVQSDFPEWFGERMREAERIRRDGKEVAEDNPAVTKYLTESLVSLRRNHASDALSASHDRIRRIAAAFIENLTTLSAQSTDVCYDFISHGEASDAVVQNLTSKPISASVDAQLSAVFEAIREGRKQPVAHLPPRKTDYDVLADELVKLGWADNDLKVFSDPRLLSRASPDQVCRLVKDWFRAHLAIADQGTQLRLLVESLRPVVAG